jgi:hypothetical protein
LGSYPSGGENFSTSISVVMAKRYVNASLIFQFIEKAELADALFYATSDEILFWFEGN